MSVPTEWACIVISEEWEQEARRLRASRDKVYRNIYKEEKTDERWVGDLGEVVFREWLSQKNISGVRWLDTDPAGQPDFVTPAGVRIDIKAVKRQGKPLSTYTAQITGSHADKPVDHFFFMSYIVETKEMWLLGGIDRDTFLKEATHYKDGDWVHPRYQVKGHDIYNIEITKLTAPDAWLQKTVPGN